MTLADHILALAQSTVPTPAERGELDTLLDRHVNTASHDQMDWFLYGRLKTAVAKTGKTKPVAERIPQPCGFAAQFKREKGKRTERTTNNVAALLALYRMYQEWVCPKCGARTSPDRKTCCVCKEHRGEAPLTCDRRIDLCLKLSGLLSQLDSANCKLCDDGRLRGSVNIAGTETFRHTTYALQLAYGDKRGYALHTTPDEHKHLLRADEGDFIGSVDLAGADGWTIAAECARCGDDAMLLDLRAGIKPAQAIALLYLHGAQVNSWARERVLGALPEIKSLGWLYPASKRVIWSTCYGSGPPAISQQILLQSYKDSGAPLFVEPRLCRDLQDLAHTRYRGIRWRQNWLKASLARDGYIEAPNGSRRVFFGRKDDPATEREAFAYSPQVMTTYVTELAWAKMWYDPDNRNGSGRRIARPLLTVHDSLVYAFPRDRVEWVRERLPAWFENPVEIAGTRVVVPYAGGYGAAWGGEKEGAF